MTRCPHCVGVSDALFIDACMGNSFCIFVSALNLLSPCVTPLMILFKVAIIVTSPTQLLQNMWSVLLLSCFLFVIDFQLLPIINDYFFSYIVRVQVSVRQPYYLLFIFTDNPQTKHKRIQCIVNILEYILTEWGTDYTGYLIIYWIEIIIYFPCP